MHETRRVVNSLLDSDRLYRSRVLDRCLLLAGACLIALVVASGAAQQETTLTTLLPQIVSLIGGAIWLLVAYLLNRRGQFQVAVGIFIALVLFVLAFGLYLAPRYALALLPLSVLPVTLAALLLGKNAVYGVAALTGLIVGVALFGKPFLPPPPGTFSPGLPPTYVGLGAVTALMALIAGALARLRETSLTLVNQVQRAGIAREQAEDMQRAAEDVRDDALDRLELQQRHLNAFAQHIGDGVVQINEHGCIVRANTVAQDIWAEVAGGEIVGQSIDTVQELLDGGSATSRYINIISLPTDGRLPNEHFTHVLLDRREHARLARLRSELVGLLADEMRNPLTSVVTALDLTLGQKNLPEDIDRVLIGARKSGQSLVDLVTTLLEITQIEQNPSILHRAPTSLCRVLEGGIAQMAPLAQQGAVTVTVEYSNDCMILMDGERMQRAFVYLLEYALRHSPTYSTVQVRIERQSGAAVVRISDQGPGLSQRQLAALFELRSAASGERGTPVLGLAFSKLIIEAHGGQLSVESTVGQGSTYAFLLPTDQEMAPMLLPPSQESELLHTEYGVR